MAWSSHGQRQEDIASHVDPGEVMQLSQTRDRDGLGRSSGTQPVKVGYYEEPRVPEPILKPSRACTDRFRHATRRMGGDMRIYPPSVNCLPRSQTETRSEWRISSEPNCEHEEVSATPRSPANDFAWPLDEGDADAVQARPLKVNWQGSQCCNPSTRRLMMGLSSGQREKGSAQHLPIQRYCEPAGLREVRANHVAGSRGRSSFPLPTILRSGGRLRSLSGWMLRASVDEAERHDGVTLE